MRHAVTRGGSRWVVRTAGADRLVEGGLADLLALPLDEARSRLDSATPVDHPFEVAAPVDAQEVWAAGVTYARSRDERMAESTEASIYDRVYVAERPELFFKAPAARVVGPGEPVGIRLDSDWDVPEPELGLVFNSAGELFGFVPGNDMSSRSIEGENPLYLPQAKVYEAACALGPAIVPVWAVDGPFAIRLEIDRDRDRVFEGSASTASLTRSAADLGAWLFAAMPFPAGVVLLTGTGIVPPESFSLAEGDLVRVLIDGVGTLENPVRVVGTDLRTGPRGRNR
ncbi:MAG: fumarylacetoacetate hydrolase [Acidobacteria bacterium]|nr:fumarylacetoacetate hydrolase [Acidobacteriota bacterium]